MAKITMIATKPHSFGMRTIEAEEEFEVENDQQAQSLISLGRARRRDDQSTKVGATGTGRAPKHEPGTDPQPEHGRDDEQRDDENGDETASPKRTSYATRRMKAKE